MRHRPVILSGYFVLGAIYSNIMAQNSKQITQEVENLIREHQWNQDLMQHLVEDYEIVFPYQVRDRSRVAINTRNYFFTNATIHFDRCTFVIRSSYRRFKLHLAQNRLLIPFGALYKQVFNDSYRNEVRGEDVEHCYYQGEVHNEEESKVAVSTCEGIRGVIIVPNQTYFILPLRGGDLGRRHAHVLIRAKFHQKLGCAVSGLTEWSVASGRKQAASKRRGRRDGGKETKYIELAVIVDQSMLIDFDASFSSLTRFILEAVNGVDLILSDLNTRVSLVQLEVWTSNNPIDINDGITQTMLNFVKFASTVVYSERTDVMLLVTSMKFLRQETALAIPGSVCTARATGVVSAPNRFEEHQLSVVMAHTTAHIVGMKHDDETCDCPDKHGCLMTQSMNGKRMRFVHGFSSCNRRDYLAALSTPQTRCLFNRPLETSLLALCGNRIVDEGEQCDCGAATECHLVDPCCDPVTCTLRDGAECGSGPCCRDCKLLPSSRVCRPADDECDVPEYCTTKSGQCPPDARKLNGEACETGEGVCYHGKCASGRKQCIELWGVGADRAETACFEKFNGLGIESGNCGYDERNKPKPCSKKNALCGLLHCKGGLETPAAPSYFKMEFAAEGNTYECKVVTMGNNSTYVPGMIMDGAKCGVEKVCLHHSCVDLDTIAVKPQCPTNNLALPCSGHGICTSENTCVCNTGWTGDECGMKMDISAPTLYSAGTSSTSSSITQGVPFTDSAFAPTLGNGDHLGGGLPTRLDTHTMFIILGGVAGAVSILLLFLVLCYRRRTKTNLRKKLNSKHKTTERESEASFDTAHRSIRFGSLPSYRDEKMQMKHKKRPLHQINETDEKESISTNKSRESGHSVISAGPQADDSLSKSPERGILKTALISGAISDRALSDIDDPCTTSPLMGGRGMDGYESEPPRYTTATTAHRVFQNSLRRLNECGIFRAGPVDNEPSSSNDCMNVTSNSDTHYPLNMLNYPHHHPGTNFIRYSSSGDERNIQRSESCSPKEYAGGHFRLLLPAYGVSNTRETGPTVPPFTSQQQRPSSPESVVSAKQENTGGGNGGGSANGGGLTRPQPLKLKNIEFLLRQLEQQQQTPICCSALVSPSSSTTEMSATEADKIKEESEDQREEAGSNTESHRDENGSSRYQLAPSSRYQLTHSSSVPEETNGHKRDGDHGSIDDPHVRERTQNQRH